MLLSLAAGVHPELANRPVDFVTAAAEAGWSACGLWFDPETWTESTTKEVKQRLDSTGLVALDMEIYFLEWDDDLAQRMIAAAHEIGVRNILSVTREEDPEINAERFGTFCRQADGTNLRVCLEFLKFMGVRNLDEALTLMKAVNNPRAGMLVDNLHLARCGTSPEALREIDPGLFPYAQWCDAVAKPEDDSLRGLRIEAMDLRRNIGEGGLPCAEFVQAMPSGIPLSIEVRSKALRDNFPDFTERARNVLEATQAGLADTN